jgi:hypothetical protein
LSRDGDSSGIQPCGAAILVDGFETGLPAPRPITGLSDGDHRVTASLSGYLPDEAIVRASRDPAAATVSPGTLEPHVADALPVNSPPRSAGILIDGIRSGETTTLHPFFPMRIDSREVTVTGLEG